MARTEEEEGARGNVGWLRCVLLRWILTVLSSAELVFGSRGGWH